MHVPRHVREEDEECDASAEPDPGPCEGPPLRRQQDPDHEGEGVDRHRVLVLQAEPGDEAEPEPQPLVAGLHDADDHVRAARPEQGLEGVHREEVVHHDVDAGQRARHGREAHREAPAAHLPREEAGEQDERRAGEGRGQPRREERGAERVPDEPGHHGDERGLVHVAPVEVLAAGHEVQLVAEVPVARRGGEVHQQLPRRDHEHDADPAGEPRPRSRHRWLIREPGPVGSRGNGPAATRSARLRRWGQPGGARGGGAPSFQRKLATAWGLDGCDSPWRRTTKPWLRGLQKTGLPRGSGTTNLHQIPRHLASRRCRGDMNLNHYAHP